MTADQVTCVSGVLSQQAMDLYARITQRKDQIDADPDVLKELQTWNLVHIDQDPDGPSIPVALDPREAARRRLTMQVEEQRQHLVAMESLAEMVQELTPGFDQSRWWSGSAEYLEQRETVNGRIGDAVAQAETEILAAQPGGPRSREHVDIAVERDSKALERGIRMQTLYRASVRRDVVTSGWAQVMSARGGQFRTLESPFQQCVIVDRRVAFIRDYVVDGGPDHAAWQVTDRAVVAFIAETFQGAWHAARPWHGEHRAGESHVAGTRTSRIQREILRDMTAGVPQTRTAARLGISRRTLTSHLAELRALWGVTTLAELGYQWGQSPDHDVDDSVPGGQAA